MEIVGRLIKEHGEMLGILDVMFALLAQAEKIQGEERGALVEKRLPGLQERLLGILKRHEHEEGELLSGEAATLNGVVGRQHMEIDEVFRIASALIYLKDPGNLHTIQFALRRIQDDLKQHFAYEERVVFPRLPASATS